MNCRTGNSKLISLFILLISSILFLGSCSHNKDIVKDGHSNYLSATEFNNEEYIIRSNGNNLLIAGGGTRGTLYGVMGYLSDHLGWRWNIKNGII